MKKQYTWMIAILICLVFSFLTGIKTNVQTVNDMNTFVGGIPFTWFQLFYVKELTVWEAIKAGKMSYSFDPAILVINIVAVNFILKALIQLFKKNILKKEEQE